MPEVHESEASFRIANAAVTKLLDAGVHLAVEGIEIDASEKEAARFCKGHPARDGLPYEIESDCTVKCGINKAQSPVYPPMWHTTSKTKSATNLVQTLALKGLSYSYRALILDLGPLFHSIQWLTHTSVQMYPRSVYESTIKLVNKNLRKARVGMAFVFKDHVFGLIPFSGAGMITEVKGEARRRTLFSYIVQQTRMVAIGPLEYCGNAHQVHIGSSTVIAPCFGDPTLPEYFAIRDLKTRILAPVLPGSRRPALSATEEAELDTQLAEYSKAVLRKRARDGEGDENHPLDDVPAKPKRSRLSADKRLALMTVN
ncbi:hypothetical protein B0H14DRAFT_3143845 [Mycena olivaceomarginata]|nr:hypothetical protein B0H14DRAFT_3143845 [Mycena olivaceomarginata]